MKTKRNIIIAVTALACVMMGVVDAVIQPGYLVKSLIKILLFLLIPVLYSLYDRDVGLKKLFVPDKKGLLTAVILGVGVYAAVVGAYFAFRGVFDFSELRVVRIIRTRLKALYYGAFHPFFFDGRQPICRKEEQKSPQIRRL